MAEAVVSFVVERVGDLIIHEVKSLYGVGDQVDRAQTELQLMQGFLKDADAKQRDDETVRIWVAKIRDAAYDLEDVIEIYVFKVASKRKGGMKNVLKRFSCIFNEGVDLHKIGAEIESITINISNLRLSMQTYNIRELRESAGATSVYERQQQLRRTYSHIIERDVVGLEDNVKELVMQLVKEETYHQVISIWGMGGLGKTTLAKQVYHHNEIRRHFHCFAWVCISQRCQVRDVWEGILMKLISASKEERKEIAKMKDDEIAKRLFLVQQERRCLIVLDDIWSSTTWELLKVAFPLQEETGSRILLTTRNKEVALHSDGNGFLHQPRPLDDDESWKLFEKIAISGRNERNFEMLAKMKEVGKSMLQHCAGLPLAITVLAGLLARKDTINEWDMVHKNVDVYIRRGKGHEQEFSGASWVMALSYDDLPYHLKPCFLYLGNFPEDSEIPVKRLTQLWMAEGLISLAQQRQGLVETMEDVAYSLLSELVERSVVQVGARGSVRNIKTCRLHDLMRDLCLLKAEEENFFQIVSYLGRNEAMYPFSSSMVTKAAPMGKVRRLAIYVNGNADKLVPSKSETEGHLRSLLYFGPNSWKPKSTKVIQSLFKNFKLLRVLKVEGMETWDWVELPSEIGNMVHLRFLSLRGSSFTQFPSSLGNLIRLQTLDLRCNRGAILPDVIWKMEHLRHLYLPLYYRTSNGLRLSTLCNLQTLTLLHVSTGECDLNDLTQLTNLRKLEIHFSNLTSPVQNLEEILRSTSSTFNRIQSLFVHNGFEINDHVRVKQIVLSCPQIYKLELNGSTVELPKELECYPNLTKLSLWRCRLKDGQMAILEKLPNLRTLRLQYGTFEQNTTTLVCSKGGFRRLEFLSLDCMDEIEEWKVEEGAMSSLCRLSIDYCRGLKTVPDGLRHVTTLREITITEMPMAFHSRLQEGGEDFYKIQHVPSVVFGKPRG